MKKTPLTDTHSALGAKMMEFAGYTMPVVYTSIREEHLQVRNHVGVFDVSHMGEFIIRGAEALDLVQRLTSNNAARLEIGQAQYSCMPNMTGGIMDDLLVYRLDEDQCSAGERAYMLVVNAANIDKDWKWVVEHNTFDTAVINISDQTGLLAVQGPRATALLQSLTDTDLESIKFYHFKKGTVAGVENVLISATGYTGSGGFELYARSGQLPVLWNALFNVPAELRPIPAGLGARDTLRLEMGYCLYGNDIDETTSPVEAGLGWITKTKKGYFHSVEIFRQQRQDGVDRKLVGFIAEGRRVPRQHYTLMNESQEHIGHVTSGTLSPCLDKPIGMGYVKKAYAAPGQKILVDTGKKHFRAEIVKLPFYPPD